jgi:organic hydroperoxide reductase OsmC/OhrA
MTAKAKTFVYTTSLVWREGLEGVLSSEGKPHIPVSPPPDFRGRAGRWTPESLFIASVETCLLFTFLSLARSRHLEFASYESEAEGLLEQVYGKLVISKVTVRPKITIASEEEREEAEGIVEVLDDHCFISNSVESEIVIEPQIVVAS